MNLNMVAGMGAALLSLAFKFVPKLKDWYAKKSPRVKQLVYGGFLLVGIAFLFLLSCGGIMDVFNWPGVTCDESGFIRLAQLAFSAFAAGGATYIATSKQGK